MDLNKRLYDLGTAAGERQNENFGSLLGATGEMLGGLAQALGSSDLEPPSGLIASPDQPMPAPARLPPRGGRRARRDRPLTSELPFCVGGGVTRWVQDERMTSDFNTITRLREPAMNRFVFALVAAATAVAANSAEPDGAQPSASTEFKLHPIGHVKKSDGHTRIVLDQKYQQGLLGLEQWSHVQVIWWFDQNDTPQKRSILQVHPRGDRDNPLTGVFACRAPVRPNLIALSLCKVLAVKDNVIELEAIDAFEGTPVLDIKPFAPGQDLASGVKVPPWAGPK